MHRSSASIEDLFEAQHVVGPPRCLVSGQTQYGLNARIQSRLRTPGSGSAPRLLVCRGRLRRVSADLSSAGPDGGGGPDTRKLMAEPRLSDLWTPLRDRPGTAAGPEDHSRDRSGRVPRHPPVAARLIGRSAD